MFRIINIFLLAIVYQLPLIAEARDAINSSQYLTYKEFSNLYRHKQFSSKKFSSAVRSKSKTYQGNLNKPIKVAIIYPGKQASDYWQRSVSSFEARLAESKVPYEIYTYFTKPGAEVRLQSKQISNALKRDPDYLIFTLDALKHRAIIERLMGRDRPKLILQNITTPLGRWGETQPFMYVGFDHATGTELLVDEYLKKFNKQGRYAIFYGTKGYVSKMRGGTFKSLMLKEPNMELIAEYYTGFNRNRAYKAAKQLLAKTSDLDFIFSCSTDIALGVLDAIREQKPKSNVITNGWGGGSKELEVLQKGELDLTVMRMNDDNGVAMAEAILWQLDGKSVPTIYSGDMVLVKRDTNMEDLDSYAKRAFRYSNRLKSDINSVLRSAK
ncbi:MAG: substrate-binding domain-containing protein [Magnetococcales bacterium]|nr:substrate-binding domain-containing protein [Magnetococcales bacterium]